jgi:hypothetical protein
MGSRLIVGKYIILVTRWLQHTDFFFFFFFFFAPTNMVALVMFNASLLIITFKEIRKYTPYNIRLHNCLGV